MTMIRQVMPLQAEELGPNRVRVIAATSGLARDGHILEMAGADVRSFRRIGVILWNHDPSMPVGNPVEVDVGADQISLTIDFAPGGASAKADEIRALVKSGVIRAVSVGFDPVEMEPLDPKKPRGGQRITKWEMLECSFVSVPADVGAIVTARAAGQSKQEPVAMTPEEKKARERHLRSLKTRMLSKPGKPVLRGLYDVAMLAQELEWIGYIQSAAQWESEVEGDASAVPAMLGEALMQLGKALVAMTVEETNELLASVKTGAEDEGMELDAEEMDFVDAGTSERARSWRRGIIAARRIRAGKVLSQTNKDALNAAHDKIEEARCMVRSVLDGADPDADDTDGNSNDVQTSGGDADKGGTSGRAVLSADVRRRQADLLALTAH